MYADRGPNTNDASAGPPPFRPEPVGAWQASQRRRSAAASIAANTRWAHEDPVAGTKAAREGFSARFLKQVDPTLPPAERQRRADRLMRAHMQRLAQRSAEVRRNVKAAR